MLQALPTLQIITAKLQIKQTPSVSNATPSFTSILHKENVHLSIHYAGTILLRTNAPSAILAINSLMEAALSTKQQQLRNSLLMVKIHKARVKKD